MINKIEDKKLSLKIQKYWLKKGNIRNHVLVVMALRTEFKMVELLRLRWSEVYDERKGEFKPSVKVLKGRVHARLKTIDLSRMVIKALALYYPEREGELIFQSRHKDRSINRIQAWRIISEAIDEYVPKEEDLYQEAQSVCYLAADEYVPEEEE